ncbi:MAG: ChaN family lipoprotein [Desulfobulbaceae bacterium]|nr:ChaN family lipoprotein [Desulfobulbaceae bacterium]
MMTFFPHINRVLFLLPFLILAAGLCSAFSAGAEDTPIIPEHTISITFDLDSASLIGTSKIELPAGTAIVLNNGPLEITGSVLEVEGMSQFALTPDRNNAIKLQPSPDNRTIYISWKYAVTNPYAEGNLISSSGITLAGFWHPIPNIDMHYNLEAELPENFTGISEGETVTYCKDRNNVRYLNTALEHPVRSIHFAAGPYTVKYRKMANDVELAAFFFAEDIALADDYLSKAESYIERYEELIGPFPYTRYSIVENRLPTGYGMPTLTLLGQAVVRLPFIQDTSLGHEILHSWFGNSVFQKESGGNWVEGLTTYLADHLYAADKEEDGEYRKNQLLRYISYVQQDNEMVLQDFASASDSQPMARKVRAIGYDKGSMLFHMLRLHLGDELFFRGVADLYREMKFKRAGWEDIETIFAATADTDLAEFFAQWLTRPDLIRFSINNLKVRQIDGRSRITFLVEQKNEQPYDFLLPVLTRTRTGEFRDIIHVNDRRVEAEIIVDELPIQLLVDPEYDLMRDLGPDEIPTIWSFFLGAENKKAVLASPDENTYAPLLEYLKSIDCEIIPADELDNADLRDGSFIFLGPSRHSLGLFAAPDYPETGFSLDVRHNPLNVREVMVLIFSSDEQETEQATRKLRHYGKYSSLHFENGKLQKSSIEESDNGIHIQLYAEPNGLPVPAIQTFDEIVDTLQDKKVVYVGEMHTDMGNHILQLQVIQALYRENPDLAIGMEMFPRSSQQALDDYISGAISTEKEFLKKSNYFTVWGYDYKYYREIINFARLKGIPLVALNIDRSIVSTVFQEGGLDTLAEDQFNEIPIERDLDVPGYRARLSQAFAMHNTNNIDAEKISGFIQAQSIWDEVMADNIVTYLQEHPEKRMVVIAGNGHVYKDSAIPPRVKRRMDVPQSVLVSINHEASGLHTGYQADYLVYTASYDIQPPAKMGVVLQEEKISETSDETRVRISQVSPHGKAGEAGVKVNDIILAAEGEKVEDITDLKALLLDKNPGDTLMLKVLRKNVLFGEREIEMEVELSSPMQNNLPPNHPR